MSVSTFLIATVSTLLEVIPVSTEPSVSSKHRQDTLWLSLHETEQHRTKCTKEKKTFTVCFYSNGGKLEVWSVARVGWACTQPSCLLSPVSVTAEQWDQISAARATSVKSLSPLSEKVTDLFLLKNHVSVSFIRIKRYYMSVFLGSSFHFCSTTVNLMFSFTELSLLIVVVSSKKLLESAMHWKFLDLCRKWVTSSISIKTCLILYMCDIVQ